MVDRPLILASASPRRAKLLQEAGFAFTQQTPPFDDTGKDPNELPVELAVAVLAFIKAMSVAATAPDAVILGCDTLLAQDGRRLGKPQDEADARRMIESLMRHEHQAITAVCLIDSATGRQQVITDVATVEPRPLSESVLSDYLHSGQWRGKAGAYNLAQIQHLWGWSARGDPSTVVGLPMRKLTPILKTVLASGS